MPSGLSQATLSVMLIAAAVLLSQLGTFSPSSIAGISGPKAASPTPQRNSHSLQNAPNVQSQAIAPRVHKDNLRARNP
jgi:hypothetical protein